MSKTYEQHWIERAEQLKANRLLLETDVQCPKCNKTLWTCAKDLRFKNVPQCASGHRVLSVQTYFAICEKGHVTEL